jgi:hypothetical protein
MGINVLLQGLIIFLIAAVATAAPSQLMLKNQFGEASKNWVQGSVMPLVPGSSNIVTLVGSGAPSDGTTGLNVAAKGSLYIRTSNGVYYVNTGTISVPAWTILPTSGAPVTSSLLTGYVFSAGTVAAGDTILQAFNKIGVPISMPLTGYVFAPGAVAATDTILQAFNKIGPVESAPSLTFDHSVGAKTITVRQIGKFVNVQIPSGAIADGAGTVCATTTGLASGFRPSAAITFAALVIDAGTTRLPGQLVVGSDGVLTFSVLGAGFTNALAAGWDSIAVSYPIP